MSNRFNNPDVCLVRNDADDIIVFQAGGFQSSVGRGGHGCDRLLIRVALDEGGLTENITPATTFEAGDFRSRYFRGDRKKRVYERVQNIASKLRVCHEISISLFLQN